MAPRPSAATALPARLLSLISTNSTVPSLDDLESLKSALDSQAASLLARIAEADPDRAKKERREKKRKERDDSSAAPDVVVRAPGLGAGKMGSPMNVKIKRERTSPSPAPSNASSASFRVPPGAPLHTYGQQKKKKRVLDSDDETPRETASPHPTHTTTSGLKVKLANQKSRPALADLSPTPSSTAVSQSGGNIDFSLPSSSSRPLIPPRPGVAKPLQAGPKRQADVNEDYSDTKAPSQVQFTTWWNTIEPYIREIREDDLAMLTLKADAPESFEIPPRGTHYTQIWEDEDGIPYPRISVPNLRAMQLGSHGGGGLPVPHFVPSLEMRDENLVDEQRGLGGLTERIVAAMMANGEITLDDEVAPDVEGGRDGMRFDVVDLEERIKKELKALMLLGDHEEYNPSARDDDEISSALRQCQRLLLQQTTINEQRKARLAEIARHRLAYTEYQAALDGVEKSIESGWSKRIKKYGVKKSNNPNALRPPVPENVRRLIRVRQGWLDTVGKCMKERPKGEVMGLPTTSVYEGIGVDDEEKDEQSVEDVIYAMDEDED